MFKIRCLFIHLPAALLVILVGPLAHAETLTGIPYTIDGDTIRIDNTRTRLHGIVAPAPKQTCKRADGKPWRCGWEAAMALANIVGEHWVTCEPRHIDRYQHVVAVCRAGVLDINDWMVRNGWASAQRRLSRDYVDAEREAKAAKRGIWQVRGRAR